MSEKVEHPKHYNQGDITCPQCLASIECIDIAKSFGFHLGNVIKYLWRHEDKEALIDLKKAKWYLDDYIRLQEK